MTNIDPWSSAKSVSDDRAEMFKFEEGGDALVGIPFKKSEGQGSRGNSTVYSLYTKSEGDDPYSMKNIWGSATLDRELPDLGGQIVKITFHGKKDIGGGQSLNMFEVKSLDDTEENREKVGLSSEIPEVDKGALETILEEETEEKEDEDITPDEVEF